MHEKLKDIGGTALGCLFMIGLVALGVFFLTGGVWAAEHVLPYLAPIAFIAFLVDLVVLLPLAAFRRLRGFLGFAIYLSSYLFGIVTWLIGLLLAYHLWGLGAVIIGLILAGVGVVPIAMLATLFKGMWAELITLILLVIVTFGTRGVGDVIAGVRTSRRTAPDAIDLEDGEVESRV